MFWALNPSMINVLFQQKKLRGFLDLSRGLFFRVNAPQDQWQRFSRGCVAQLQEQSKFPHDGSFANGALDHWQTTNVAKCMTITCKRN